MRIGARPSRRSASNGSSSCATAARRRSSDAGATTLSGLHRRRLRTSHAPRARQVGGAAACRVRARCARRRRPGLRRCRRLLLRRRRTRRRSRADGRLHEPQGAARRRHRIGGLLVHQPRGPCRAGDRPGALLGRARHAGRQAAQRWPGDGHRVARAARGPALVGLGEPYGWTVSGIYANFACRHMHEHGTTSEQLAWVKVAASMHAQHNPHALLRKVFTVEDVLNSPMVADPLHRLDCCVITDGGGALVVTRPEIARSLRRPMVAVRGFGETVRTGEAGDFDMLRTGAAISGRDAFESAGLTPRDVKYASIYDNFTIMVILQLEDLGFCARGEGGRFVADGGLVSGVGRLPWNTDGGGLCNNHPQNRGGMTKVIEAMRQLRGEAHAAVQVPNCDIAMATGPGMVFGIGHSHATLLMERTS
ncbi:thiolase domain-containing protein [Variovorax sp. UC122_21]|uniref:thiolase domain-containing protein n=1 Tax=Variovorax sp. UC122_21 TaxID=3374554 RepID=UPI003757A8EA